MKRTHLRLLREKKGLTQDALSAKSGVPQAVISQLETNRSDALFSTVDRLATALGVDPRALVFGPDDRQMAS
jgi:transcriptional regulator with XRE-family HTH domain